MTDPHKNQIRSQAKTILLTIFITLLVVALSAWAINHYLFPTHFSSAKLSSSEIKTLNKKLQQVSLPTIDQKHTPTAQSNTTLTPERYSEERAPREIAFSEREVNAFLAHNSDLSDKLAIDLSDNLISAKWLLPLDPDFPLLGGKTLKLTAGLEVAYRHEKPVIKLRGVSLWGIPLPDAWLGYMKNVDLIKEFGGENQQGFWKNFADGIDYVEVNNGDMIVKLKQ